MNTSTALAAAILIVLSLARAAIWAGLAFLACGGAVPPLTAQESRTERTPGYLGVVLDQTRIQSVTPGSPAERAGLRSGDVLLAIDGAPIKTREDVTAALSRKRAGQTIVLEFRRGEAAVGAKIVLGKQPERALPFSRRRPKRTKAPRHYVRQGEPLAKEQSLEAGLRWIASQQKRSGRLPAKSAFSDRFDVAMTALGGMALMLDPQFGEQADKALAFLLRCCHENGYIYYKKPTFKGMWEHGFATQFLAEALIRKKMAGEEAAELEKLQGKLERAIALIVSAQNLEGGWGYRPRPDPHAEVGPGAAQLDALLLAKRAGVQIQEGVIQKGLKSQYALMLPPGRPTIQGEWRSFSYEANAFVLASLLGWKNRPEIEVYLEALERVRPAAYFARYTEQTPMVGVYWSTGYHTLGLFYTALAYRRLGADARKEFTRWHAQVVRRLTKLQNEAGAFKGWFGDVYGTAFACLTLGADTDGLQMFRAAGEGFPQTAAIEPAERSVCELRGQWKLAV